jgi:hypothetical protein
MPILGVIASGISGHLTPPSSFYSIATVTAAGGETSLSFTSIPSTYKSLQIRGIARTTAAIGGVAECYWRANADAGANYAFHRLYGDGTSAVATGIVSQTEIQFGPYQAGSGTTAGTFGSAILDIVDYASTSKNKTFRIFQGLDANTASTTFRVATNSGVWLSTSAISSLTIYGSAAFAAGSTFALYGIL